MESVDKMKRHVSFADDVKEQNSTFTPQRVPHYSAIKKKTLQLLNEGNYEELKKYLISCETSGVSLKSFFVNEGASILDWALISAPSVQPLGFICESFSNDIIRNLLIRDNFYLLDGFLLSQSCIDKYYQIDNAGYTRRLEKFKLLLNVAPEEVQGFMNKNTNNISQSVKDSFLIAQQQPRSSNKSIIV